MRFKQFLIEEEKKKETKIVFKETDGSSAFPDYTITAIEKNITTLAKDLEQEWSSASDLVDAAFTELDVPLPLSFMKDRWEQYVKLLSHAVSQLYKSRGLKATWSKTI